jgi:hypothetical protein
MFFRDVENPKWDKLEKDHLDKFYSYCKAEKLPNFPQWYPEAEILRQLHAESWNYQKAYKQIEL